MTSEPILNQYYICSGPNQSWTNPEPISCLDPFGHRSAMVYIRTYTSVHILVQQNRSWIKNACRERKNLYYHSKRSKSTKFRGGSLPEILNYLPDRARFSWVPLLIQIQVKFLFRIPVRQIVQYTLHIQVHILVHKFAWCAGSNKYTLSGR